MRRRGDIWTGVTGIAFALLLVLLIIPLGRLLWASLLGDDGGFTLKHYREFLAYPYYSRTIGHSFLVSGLVTLCALVVAIPVAFLIARVDIPGKTILKSLAILPLVSPPFIGAYSWILLFGRAGYVTTLLQKGGITIPTVYGMHGIVLALSLNLYPFVLLMVAGALQALDLSLEEAAQGLGSSPWRVFWTVTVPVTMPSILGGAMLVFLFSSLAIKAVGRTAQIIIQEVRRQFKANPDIMKGTADPDYGTCVDIVTRGALKAMIVPGILPIVCPVAVGLIFRSFGVTAENLPVGAVAVAAFLMVATIVGILMALMMNNGGGAWDNAKKLIETGVFGGKGTDAHKAAIVGDTVGDPFKDTAGPSLHVLIKLLSTITLVAAPLFL